MSSLRRWLEALTTTLASALEAVSADTSVRHLELEGAEEAYVSAHQERSALLIRWRELLAVGAARREAAQSARVAEAAAEAGGAAALVRAATARSTTEGLRTRYEGAVPPARRQAAPLTARQPRRWPLRLQTLRERARARRERALAAWRSSARSRRWSAQRQRARR